MVINNEPGGGGARGITDLYHSLPDEKMDFYYRTNDWEKLSALDPNYIEVKGFKIPYAVFENEPEKTLDPVLIGNELERITKILWSRMK